MRLGTFLIVNMRLLIFMRLRVVKAIKLTMLFDPNVSGQKVSLMYSSVLMRMSYYVTFSGIIKQKLGV